MNVLWEGVKATATIVGQAAVHTGKIGKLQTELLLMKRDIENRKRAFGEELYDYVVSLLTCFGKGGVFFAHGLTLLGTWLLFYIFLYTGAFVEASGFFCIERSFDGYVTGTVIDSPTRNIGLVY
jgi:hypothetical protein